MTGSRETDSATLEALDRKIIRCLQLRPRAPFSAVAEVLEVSEQTVARRYRRLVRDGMLRIIAVASAPALGQSEWLLRVQCRPEGILDLARALARRDDTGFVSVVEGGAELICALRSTTRQARERLLLDRLPRTVTVTGVRASVVLRRFRGGPTSTWLGVAQELDDAQAAVFGVDPPATHTGETPVLTEADRAMLAVLTQDGRSGYAALARAAGTTEARATRRLTTLLDTGAVYLDVDLASGPAGFPVSAFCWLTVSPSQLSQVCAAVATLPEVPFVAAVSGQSNVALSLVCRSLDHLYELMTERIGVIDGITGSELSPVLMRFKQAGTLLEGDRLLAPQ